MQKRIIWLLSALLLLCSVLTNPAMAAETAAYEDTRWTNGVYDSTLGDMAGRRLYVYGIVDSDREITEQSTDKDVILNADQAAGRLDAALYFYRLCGIRTDVECPFPDVPEAYTEAIAWLYSEGIVNGVGNGLYGVGNISEYQVLLILSRLIGWGTEERDALYAIAEEAGLLPVNRHEELFTRGELFQILCSYADTYCSEHLRAIRPEMSTPRRISVYADSYESAKRQIQEAAEFLPRSIIVEFAENCPNEEIETFRNYFDWSNTQFGFPMIEALNLTHREPCSLVQYSDRRYVLRLSHYAPAYLAFADTLDWLRIYADESFSSCLTDFVEKTILPLQELPSECERIRAAHDLLCDLADYDYEFFNGDRKEAHQLLGFFLRRKIVCDGYANVYQWMLKYLGIKSYVVVGLAGGVHAWNRVFLEDAWYNVDVCWADTGTDHERYFLKSDAWFETNDHSFTDFFSSSTFVGLKDYGEYS